MIDNTRQFATTVDRIRPDHVARYRFAAERLKGKKVLDLACGCGYGSWILHQAGNDVLGVDIEPEAVVAAWQHYPGPDYKCDSAEEPHGIFDAVVSFETLEHLAFPEVMLENNPAPLIIASVPNEEHFKFKAEKFAGDKYPHLRHYTPKEFEELLGTAGYRVEEWFCQKDKLGEIVPGTDGSFIIAIGSRISKR